MFRVGRMMEMEWFRCGRVVMKSLKQGETPYYACYKLYMTYIL